MKTFFLVLSVVFTLTCIAPYARDILKERTKPNLVSWTTWTLLTSVATLAAWSAGERAAAIFTGSAALETLLIVLLGLSRGYVKYTVFDIVCQLGALAGFILWWIFNSPAVAVVASVGIDLVGALPTVHHAWLKPNEETVSTYALAAVGGFFALLALTSYNWTSLPYAVYVVVINSATVVAIILGARKIALER